MTAKAYQSKSSKAHGTRRRLGLAALLALSVTAAAIPARADDDDEGGHSWWDGIGSSIGNTFKGASKRLGLGKPPPPPQAESPSGCPSIEVLDGTGAQRVMANAAAGNAGLKYQYSIINVARECHLSGNQMVLKVGVEGKVLLGPQGAPGSFDVPVRIAVVNQADDKPVLSKLYKVAASIPAGQTWTPYTLVADSISVPFSGTKTAQDYSIKVGIDTGGKGDVAPKAAHRHKGHHAATATAAQ